ncbi:hypothetical protein [Robertkochia sediminum]|uniref:hypothetical protein n=1 Tax=Robertkochia sediminum TaxID=2785326 RepID=UPI001931F676|nr:hypothetical protein [Robertkochia sediminum]MBL7471648.1 hypothetical protein [Robertkochia sediminum]
MKIMISLLASIAFTLNMNSQSDHEFIFSLHFQDYFDNDTVSFHINDRKVFQHEILDSDKSVGITDFTYTAYKKGDTIVIYRNKTRESTWVISEKATLSFTILINDVKTIIPVDLKRGTFLGIEKGIDGQVLLNQATRAFFYD